MKQPTPAHESITTIVDLLITDVQRLASDVRSKQRALTLEEIRGLNVASKTITDVSEFTKAETKNALAKKSTAELKELLRAHPLAKAALAAAEDDE